MLVDIPQDGADLQTYAQNITENYIIAHGIIGTACYIDADKVYDYHTLYKPNIRTVMTINVDLDMNQKKILNILADEAIDNSVATVKRSGDKSLSLHK